MAKNLTLTRFVVENLFRLNFSCLGMRALFSIIISLFIFTTPSFCDSVDRKPEIVVSIEAVNLIIKEITGPYANITSIVKGNTDPHSFEISVSEMKQLSTADAIFFVGRGLEYWDKALPGNIFKKVSYISSGLKTNMRDMHVWLDPVLVKDMLPVVTRRLCSLAPENCTAFEDRQRIFEKKLDELDIYIKKKVSEWENKSFLAYHPAWMLFSERYGLIQLAVLKGNDDTPPSASAIANLLKTAKSMKVRVFISEPSVSRQFIARVTEELDLKVVELDHTGSKMKTYVDLIQDSFDKVSRYME